MRLIAFATAFVVFLGISLAGAGSALAQHAEFRLGGRDTPHAGVPFQLDLLIDGFDEQPQPDAPKLEIAGADVAFVAAQPNVSHSIQMVNGRVTQQDKVTWVMRWRVQPRSAGRLRIPAVTISQGSKRVTTEPAEAEVDTIAVTDSMKLSISLPERPIFVGETVPVTLTWLFRSQPVEDPTWAIPVMTMDAFTVSGPPASGSRKALSFPAGAKDLQLPYDIDELDRDGVHYHRLVTTFYLAPRKVGKLDIPASSVVAALQTGRADFFGNASSHLFRAVDAARTIDVKALPETDKPANFAGAVGEQFSIDVTTSRSVVKLGEPVELAIRIKSNQRLDTLALGRIDGDAGLPRDKFVVPSDPPTGELSDDGKTKTFKVTAQVTGAATEVPAIAFAYFDPAKTAYQTIHSEPIALSVAGGSVVGAAQVVAAAPAPAAGTPAAAPTDLSLVDAELALSTAGQESDQPFRGGLLWLVVGVLYAIPLALYAARSWQLRTQGQREDAAEIRAARRRVEDLLDKAAAQPARELAGPLAGALRDLARLAGHDTTAALDDGGLLARLETESFSPGAAATPLSADLRSDAAGLLRRWAAEARRAPAATTGATRAAISLLVVGASLALGASIATAAPAPATAPTAGATANRLDDGRAAYQEAMQQTSATRRKIAFARAEAAFGDAVAALPDRPELLADWGNAALGAGDLATATLAYRRALALDGDNPRARHNLAWLRGQKPTTFRPPGGSAADTLLFFHAWSRARKLVVGSAAFAIAILLLVPWAGRKSRGLAALSILPFAIWLAMLASVVLEDRHPDDAVVMQDVVLRAADSAGAPAALSQPLPRGIELTVLERRDTWTKVRIASGMAGWVPAGAVERVTP